MSIQDFFISLLILLVVVLPVGLFFFPGFRWRLQTWHCSRWPEMTAVVHMAGAEYMEGSEGEPGYNRSLFGYSYLVSGARYAGFLALITDDIGQAAYLQRKLEGQSILIRFNPMHPSISVLTNREIEGFRALQTPRRLRPGTDLQQLGLSNLSSSEPESRNNQ